MLCTAMKASKEDIHSASLCALQTDLDCYYSIPEPPQLLPLYKWSAFISDEMAGDARGNIDSGPLAGQIRGEQH